MIVLPSTDTLGMQEADANTLRTLRHLRDIRTRGDADFRIVTEMIDLKNR